LSEPETEYGAEAYLDCPRSDYHPVLYLAPRNLRIKIGEKYSTAQKKKGKEDGVNTVSFVYTAVPFIESITCHFFRLKELLLYTIRK